VEIVPAGLDDVDELARVEVRSKLRSIPRLAAGSAVDVDARRERWRTYLSGVSPETSRPERIVLKAVGDGETVGYLAGHLTTRFGLDAEIQSFYVLRERQRRGIGTALLARFVSWLRAHGAATLCVGIAPENPYQAFYLKHGGAHLNPHWIAWTDLGALPGDDRDVG
jgi:GNAT superfamily N-acetyltransferase